MIARGAALAVLLLVIVAGNTLDAEAREFRLGIVSKKAVQKKIAGYDPLARYVAQRLKPQGVTAGKVVVTRNLEAMLVKIRKGEVDVVLETPYSALRLLDEAGMEPKLVVWKEGARSYRTVFFVRKESPIKKLEDLKGKVLALQDPGSTSGYFIPLLELKERDLKAAPLKKGAPPGSVRYHMVEHEKNQVFWVLQKRAAAAAFGTDDWEDLREPVRKRLKIVHTSQPVLRNLALFHPDLPPQLGSAIVSIMTQMHLNQEGVKALKQASDTTRIEPLSPEDSKSLEQIHQLMRGL